MIQCLLLLLLALLFLGLSKASNKKGSVLSASTSGANQLVNKVHPSWYYNWGYASTANVNNSIPFVPMIWGESNVAKISTLPTPSQGGSRYLLGFNEPDGVTQSNLTVSRALALWSQLAATPFLLGSPATASNPTKSGSWLEQFMSGKPIISKTSDTISSSSRGSSRDSKSRGSSSSSSPPPPRVDFICLHWYAPPNVTSFLNFIDDTWNKFHKPIWVTEFAVADWNHKFPPHGYSVNATMTFMKDAMIGLEKRSYVQRYTWKTRSTTDPAMGNSALYNADGSLTALGVFYSNFQYKTQATIKQQEELEVEEVEEQEGVGGVGGMEVGGMEGMEGVQEEGVTSQ